MSLKLVFFVFALIFMAWSIMANISSENTTIRTIEQAEQEINLSQHKINSTEFAIAKIEKGIYLIEKDEKRNGVSTVPGSATSTKEGIKEIKEALKILKN